jgi:hypothetical protein
MAVNMPEPRYSMIIEWEPLGEVYVVTVPEFPGCRTHGATYEEAVAQGQVVVDRGEDTLGPRDSVASVLRLGRGLYVEAETREDAMSHRPEPASASPLQSEAP